MAVIVEPAVLTPDSHLTPDPNTTQVPAQPDLTDVLQALVASS